MPNQVPINNNYYYNYSYLVPRGFQLILDYLSWLVGWPNSLLRFLFLGTSSNKKMPSPDIAQCLGGGKQRCPSQFFWGEEYSTFLKSDGKHAIKIFVETIQKNHPWPWTGPWKINLTIFQHFSLNFIKRCLIPDTHICSCCWSWWSGTSANAGFLKHEGVPALKHLNNRGWCLGWLKAACSKH